LLTNVYIYLKEYRYAVVDPGGAHPARALLPPLKLEKIRFFGV
jgi:hypothetical protein